MNRTLKLKTNLFTPRNIHCLALNYKGVSIQKDHRPLYFTKSSFAICDTLSTIKYPYGTNRLWTEVELGIVVGKNAKFIAPENAANFIKGFTVCADVTCNNIHGRDHHLPYSKSRENFAPILHQYQKLSPKEASNLALKTYINNIITQDGHTSEMILSPTESLSYISQIVPLFENDVILTGTPMGHEQCTLAPGDRVLHIIENVGQLEFLISN